MNTKQILGIPKDQRKGQAIFNFLMWLNRDENGIFDDHMYDPFDLPDATFDYLWKEWLKSLKK